EPARDGIYGRVMRSSSIGSLVLLHGTDAAGPLDPRRAGGHSPRPPGPDHDMTQAIDARTAARPSHLRIVGAVSAAHFVSHYYILLLAPLMPFVRDEYGVSYTEIGLAFAAFNIVSALL